MPEIRAAGICVRRCDLPTMEARTPPHAHVFDHLTLAYGGKVQVWLDGVPHDLAPGQHIFVPAGVLHAIEPLEPQSGVFCCFAEDRDH